MSEYSLKETLEDVSEYIGEGIKNKLKTKQDIFRFSTMPIASEDYLGKCVQYTGISSQSFQHNYFYECKAQGTSPETYEWEQVRVSDASEDRISSEITDIGCRYDTSRSNRILEYMSIDLAELLTKDGRIPTQDDCDYAVELYEDGKISKEEFLTVYNVCNITDITYAYELYQEGIFTNVEFAAITNDLIKGGYIPFGTSVPEIISIVCNSYYDGLISLSDIQQGWNVGDTMSFNIPAIPAAGIDGAHNAETVTMAIMDFNHDNLTTAVNSKTKSLITLGMVDLFSWTGRMNTTESNSGGWASTGRRTWCNGACYNALPQVWRDMIKSVTKISAGSSNTDDKIFLPSTIEVLGSGEGGGSRYKYYTNGGSVKKKKNGTSTNIQYFVRSTPSNSSTGRCFQGITTGGGRSDDPPYASSYYGQQIMFCI